VPNRNQKPNQAAILIADDDPIILELLQRILEKEGYSCTGVPDGKLAEQALKAQSFDLLISDIDMPGNQGLELVHRASQLSPGISIILLTGNPTVETAMKSVQMPVTAYLTKPADPAELKRLVRESVSAAKAFRSLSASRQRLVEWAQDLGKIEDALRQGRQSQSLLPINNYLQVTAQNLLMILMDWKQVMDSSVTPQPVQQEPIVAALMETIDVLEKTKRAFKSRELGELRKKLEKLLST
jgi:DNA-binding response OmpR family regulator